MDSFLKMFFFIKKQWTIVICVVILLGLEKHGVFLTSADVQNDEKLTQLSFLKKTRLLQSARMQEKVEVDLSAVLQTAVRYIERKDELINITYQGVVSVIDQLERESSISFEVRRKILDRLKKVALEIEKDVSIPSLVARRGGLRTEQCTVLAVNRALNAVIVDAGYQSGVVLGGEWFIESPNPKNSVRLHIVEVRRTISAAIPIGTDIELITTGMVASKAKKNTFESKENYGN